MKKYLIALLSVLALTGCASIKTKPAETTVTEPVISTVDAKEDPYTVSVSSETMTLQISLLDMAYQYFALYLDLDESYWHTYCIDEEWLAETKKSVKIPEKTIKNFIKVYNNRVKDRRSLQMLFILCDSNFNTKSTLPLGTKSSDLLYYFHINSKLKKC